MLSVFESPLGSVEGHRIIWVRSTSKRTRDAAARAGRLERSTSGLDDLAHRLAGPKCRPKTRAAVQDAAVAYAGESLRTDAGPVGRCESQRTVANKEALVAGLDELSL